ncbi:SART-1 family protein DOT2 [Mercurialis annua]|uniref:SART-1 family protein DOT2 n=1 Tax=Mercurialis annua TaxID=3986 RepID=UPI002160DC92|nr:SART-1 family protein DOT2 [Mercurialis annua]
MEMDLPESRYEDGVEKPSSHSTRDKDRKKSSRGEDRDTDYHRSKDRERSKRSKEDIGKDSEKNQDENVDRERGKDRSSRDSKAKDKDHERDKSREKDRRMKEKESERDRDREADRERGKDKNRDRDREKYKDREKEREVHKDRDVEMGREKPKDKERERGAYHDKERLRDRDRLNKRSHEDDHDRSNDNINEMGHEKGRDGVVKRAKVSFDDKSDDDRRIEGTSGGGLASTLEFEERILKMKEERLKKNSDASSEVLSWVNRSRKLLEKKNAEKEKVKQLSKLFEEQDKIVQGESDEEEADELATNDLAGVKVLHGLEKVMEGGAVVLTLKDQSILADGDLNEEVDMLENVEIGEQKRRNEAYKAAKKKTGIYDDKFNDDPALEKKLLPQYDDPATDEGVTLDARGRFTGEAEKKLEELRKRLQGTPTNNRIEDLSSSAKMSSDYYTQEEMLQFKKPKKKKSLRKKEKLDIDALEAEAVSAGLGVRDLGSRNHGRSQAIREEQERSEAERRSSAYQSAYAKADEASKSLRLEQKLPVKLDEDENPVFADDDEDFVKSLDRARKLAFKKQEETSIPQAIARLAAAKKSETADGQNPTNGESQESKVVFTEMEEFVWGLQLDEESHQPKTQDVFMDEDEAPVASDQEMKDEDGGWTEVKDSVNDENPVNEATEDIVPDETIHEVPVGKGLSGALKLLKERGTLKEGIDWGGRNMDKKKSKLVGIVDDDVKNEKFKDIRIERLDEFGRVMTPKEAFRLISHKFHGKGPGKMKQEKRMKQYLEELKLKQMKNSDTPSESVERMRETQARLKTPYLVLSGHVKQGQTSDSGNGFSTVEKDLPGGLTPMLGDKKVEHFLGIRRKAEPENSNLGKKPKN